MSTPVDIELVVRIVLRVLAELGAAPATAAPATASAPSRAPLRLVTERDVLDAVAAGSLAIAAGAVVTPSARDAAEAKRVRLVVA